MDFHLHSFFFTPVTRSGVHCNPEVTRPLCTSAELQRALRDMAGEQRIKIYYETCVYPPNCALCPLDRNSSSISCRCSVGILSPSTV